MKESDTREKHRLVLGVFGDPTALVRALGDLAVKGFTGEELCVVGTKDVLATAASVAYGQIQPGSPYTELLSNPTRYTPGQGIVSLVGTDGRVFDTLKQLFSYSSYNAHDSTVMLQLVEYVNEGFLVLVVAIAKPRQLLHASKIMLRRSTHDVQTHEFFA